MWQVTIDDRKDETVRTFDQYQDALKYYEEQKAWIDKYNKHLDSRYWNGVYITKVLNHWTG